MIYPVLRYLACRRFNWVDAFGFIAFTVGAEQGRPYIATALLFIMLAISFLLESVT